MILATFSLPTIDAGDQAPPAARRIVEIAGPAAALAQQECEDVKLGQFDFSFNTHCKDSPDRSELDEHLNEVLPDPPKTTDVLCNDILSGKRRPDCPFGEPGERPGGTVAGPGNTYPRDLTQHINDGHILELGDNNDLVKQAQRLLGVYPDGDYGPKTEEAVRALQEKLGLAENQIDGKIGSTTWPLLKANNYFSNGGTLGIGAVGAEVEGLQQMLILCGFDLGTSAVDGRYETATETAVRNLQLDNDLSANGVANADAWSTLQKARCSEKGHPTFPESRERLRSFTVDAESAVKVWKVLKFVGSSTLTLHQMSDGTYDLEYDGGIGGGLELKNSEIDTQHAIGVTFTLSPSEVLAVIQQGFLLPVRPVADHITPAPGFTITDIESRLTAVRYTVGTKAEPAGIAIDKISHDLVSLVTDALPEELAGEIDASATTEIRDHPNGFAIEVRYTTQGDLELTNNQRSTGGIFGTMVDILAFGDEDSITITGARANVTAKATVVVALASGARTDATISVEISETKYTLKGVRAGLDLPVIDEILKTPKFKFIEAVNGRFETNVTTTVLNDELQVVDTKNDRSSGVIKGHELDLIVAEQEFEAIFENFRP